MVRDGLTDLHIDHRHKVVGSPHTPADLPRDRSVFTISVPAVVEQWAREIVASHQGIGRRVGRRWVFEGRPADPQTWVGMVSAAHSHTGRAELVHTLQVIVERSVADPGNWRIVSCYLINDV